MEDREGKPYLLFTIYDASGNEVRKMIEKPSLGVNRLVWDFRLTPQSNIQLKSSEPGRYGESNVGPLALPGEYSVSIHKVENGTSTLLVDKTPFKCQWLDRLSTPADNKEELLAFEQKVDRLRKAVDAAGEIMREDKKRLDFITSAFKIYPGLDISYLKQMQDLENQRDKINIKIYGDPSLSKRDIEQKESISSRVGIIIWNMWRNRSNPTSTNIMLYETASNQFQEVISQLQELDDKIKNIEDYLEQNEVPFTPGRGLIMNWRKE